MVLVIGIAPAINQAVLDAYVYMVNNHKQAVLIVGASDTDYCEISNITNEALLLVNDIDLMPIEVNHKITDILIPTRIFWNAPNTIKFKSKNIPITRVDANRCRGTP